ncbi:uncharacterized protein OCT59_002268 [Rhizophagus irregularis]|uniref:uncharacterized protein n=1 Tax=Rhizophagus irregularis TaxID=588596 RepID=UPI003319F8EC|nr:hypothetical protein OCT59_002268 [Rhizophagus irregularis]
MEQHFGLIYRATKFSTQFFIKSTNFCTDCISKSHKIFNSFDFISISEKSLISLIKRDDLQMKEAEIWEHVLRWGLEKNPTLLPDSTTCQMMISK